MVLIGCLGEDTDVQRYLRHPPAANMGRCPRQQRDAARQTVNRPERCQVGRSYPNEICDYCIDSSFSLEVLDELRHSLFFWKMVSGPRGTRLEPVCPVTTVLWPQTRLLWWGWVYMRTTNSTTSMAAKPVQIDGVGNLLTVPLLGSCRRTGTIV